jgi:hypothetical protein
VFAGIVTLLNQYLGGSGLGLINPTLYSLAANNTTSGAFHPVKSGDNDVYCQINTPASNPADVICPSSGVVGFSASNSDPTTGYNLVGGLGSVDADKLAVAWAASRTTGSSITITPSATNVTAGTSVSFAVVVTPTSGVGGVSFSTINSGTTTALGTVALNTPYPQSQSGTATFATTALPAGTNNVTATYEGDATINGSSSAVTTVTVTIPFSLSPTPLLPVSVAAGQSVSSTITVTPLNGFDHAVNFNSGVSPSGGCTAGLPAGAACTFSQNGTPIQGITLDGLHPQNVTLTITTAADMALPSTAQAITVSGTSGNTVISTTVSLSVTKTNQAFTIAPTSGAGTYSIAAGGTEPINFTVTGSGSPTVFSPAALPLTYNCLQSSLPSETQCSFSPTNGQAVAQNTLTLTITTTPPTSELRSPLGRGNGIFYALLLPGMFGILIAAGSRKSGARLLGLIVVLGFSTMWLGSCGGGGGSNSGQKNPGTPAGTYAIVVNATTGGATPLTGTFTVNLTVTQ